jgi:hypothetical protein
MRLEDISLEYQGAALGDERRSRRLERIALELAHNPGLSFPEAMGTEGQLEALYRFLNNDDVTFEAVHAPHAEQTRLRCQAQDRVLVLHDTTLLKFNGDREGLGRIYEEGACVPVCSLKGPSRGSFLQGEGTAPFAGRRDHPRGRGEEFFAASWDQQFCKVMGPPRDRAKGLESDDREVSEGAFDDGAGRRRRSPHALPGVDHDRYQGSATPLVGVAECASDFA